MRAPQYRRVTEPQAKDEPLFRAIGRLLDGQPTEDVVPILITVSARALVQEADRRHPDRLSTLLAAAFAASARTKQRTCGTRAAPPMAEPTDDNAEPRRSAIGSSWR